MLTNLNDRWSREAMRATEPTEPAPARPASKEQVNGSSAMKIAGLDAAAIRKFTIKSVDARDKSGGQLATAEGNVVHRYIDITPDMARRWLQTNFRNRPVSDDVVKAYARDMANGVWQPTHQGIAFNDRDELIDGQHRLLAIIQAKGGPTGSVRMMVTFNLPAKIGGQQMTTMDCVDRGRTRSVADQLKIQHGLPQGGQIAQVASALAHLCVGERMRRLSVGQTLDIYREFKVEMDFIIANRSKLPGLRSAGVLGGFVFVLATQDGAGPRPGIHERPAAKMFNALMAEKEQAREPFPALHQLHGFLTGESASLILASMNRGIAELTVWTILNRQSNELAKEPSDWSKAVEKCRAQQPARVEKIAKLFALPK